MPLILKAFITRKLVQEHPDWLFLFGDNCQRKGYGGQAREMRDEPNCCGVITKVAPTTNEDAYLSDDTLKVNITWINSDLCKPFAVVLRGGVVVAPQGGLGSGRAQLKRRAPLTWEYLQTQIWALDRIGKEHDGIGPHLR